MMKPKSESRPTDIHQWKWWYRGKTVEGNIAAFKGTIEAPNEPMGDTALKRVQEMMRRKYPTIRWMHGRNIEGGSITFGPTVQRGKFIRPGAPVIPPTN